MRIQQLAFTAMDLLTAMTIIAVLLAAGIPAFRTFGMNQRMNAATAQLHSDLRYARGEAIHLNAQTVACPGNPGNGCAAAGDWAQGWFVFVDLNGDGEWQASDRLLREANRVRQLSISSSSARRRLRFYPDGSAPASNATIHFVDARGDSFARELKVSASGRIRLD